VNEFEHFIERIIFHEIDGLGPVSRGRLVSIVVSPGHHIVGDVLAHLKPTYFEEMAVQERIKLLDRILDRLISARCLRVIFDGDPLASRWRGHYDRPEVLDRLAHVLDSDNP
jgi:hypothetical protein